MHHFHCKTQALEHLVKKHFNNKQTSQNIQLLIGIVDKSGCKAAEIFKESFHQLWKNLWNKKPWIEFFVFLPRIRAQCRSQSLAGEHSNYLQMSSWWPLCISARGGRGPTVRRTIKGARTATLCVSLMDMWHHLIRIDFPAFCLRCRQALKPWNFHAMINKRHLFFFFLSLLFYYLLLILTDLFFTINTTIKPDSKKKQASKEHGY